MTNKIISAAIKFNGLIISKPAPARHPDIIKAVSDINKKIKVKPSDQGFIDANGKFQNRKDAYFIACMANQLLVEPSSFFGEGEDRELFSEDLW